jgi:hypothetical protein
MNLNTLFGIIFAGITAWLGAFVGAYLRKSGEDRAANENFAAIREQLKTTTRDTESIKQQLTGYAWRIQQQWSAREQYYSKLLTHLHHFWLALDDLSNYYMEPGREDTPDSEMGERFQRLISDASTSFTEVEKLLGPAALFLSSEAVASLRKLISEHFELENFGAMCTADYVSGAAKLASAAYDQVLKEARIHLGIEGEV